MSNTGFAGVGDIGDGGKQSLISLFPRSFSRFGISCKAFLLMLPSLTVFICEKYTGH